MLLYVCICGEVILNYGLLLGWKMLLVFLGIVIVGRFCVKILDRILFFRCIREKDFEGWVKLIKFFIFWEVEVEILKRIINIYRIINLFWLVLKKLSEKIFWGVYFSDRLCN